MPSTELQGASTVLALRGVSLYRAEPPQPDILWTIGAGETWLAFGPQDSGRTLLLEVLTALAKPRWGQVELLGHPLGSMDSQSLRRSVGWSLPEPRFLTLQVRTELTALASSWAVEADAEEAVALLERLAPWMAPMLGQKLSSLAPEEKLVVDLVRRLVGGVQVALVDGLAEVGTAQRMRALMRNLAEYARETGLSVIATTDNPLPWQQPAIKAAFLWGGSVRAEGVLSSLQHRTQPYELVRYLRDLGTESV